MASHIAFRERSPLYSSDSFYDFGVSDPRPCDKTPTSYLALSDIQLHPGHYWNRVSGKQIWVAKEQLRAAPGWRSEMWGGMLMSASTRKIAFLE